MEIRYSKAAVKSIESMDRPTKQRIRAGILELTQKPPQGDIRPMQGYSDGRLRLRVGKYRVVFKYVYHRRGQPRGHLQVREGPIMAPIAKQIADMVEILPEQDQALAYELVKKLVLAWDPDYTKLTPAEAQQVDQAAREMAAGDYVPDSAVNWD